VDSRRIASIDLAPNPTSNRYMTNDSSALTSDSWPGRSARLEYWLSVLAIVSIETAFSLIFHLGEFGQFIGFGLWLYVSARRLHDFNRSAMWGWSIFLLGMAVGLSKRTGVPFLHITMSEQLANSILALATLIVILTLGLIPGTNGQNRFGSRAVRRVRGLPSDVADIFN
jgi:uncharacterized membrane protein YhaH (DUF805 family)